mgnify:CR=1 FL=1
MVEGEAIVREDGRWEGEVSGRGTVRYEVVGLRQLEGESCVSLSLVVRAVMVAVTRFTMTALWRQRLLLGRG